MLLPRANDPPSRVAGFPLRMCGRNFRPYFEKNLKSHIAISSSGLCRTGFGIYQFLDEFWSEVDAVWPCDCVRLQREIFKGIDVCKLLHDGAVVRLDDAFEISDKTASVVEFDGYLVIANIFRVNYVKHFESSSLQLVLEKFRQELSGFNGGNGGCPKIINIARNDVIEF